MILEDHVGDIIRKVRAAMGVSLGHSASAANISPAELQQLEQTGNTAKAINFIKLGPLIGLNGLKLERIAVGWTPRPVDLSTWREIRPITTTQRMSVNCYLIWDEVT